MYMDFLTLRVSSLVEGIPPPPKVELESAHMVSIISIYPCSGDICELTKGLFIWCDCDGDCDLFLIANGLHGI